MNPRGPQSSDGLSREWLYERDEGERDERGQQPPPGGKRERENLEDWRTSKMAKTMQSFVSQNTNGEGAPTDTSCRGEEPTSSEGKVCAV